MQYQKTLDIMLAGRQSNRTSGVARQGEHAQALGVLGQVGVVCLSVNALVLHNVLDASLEVPSVATQVKPRSCMNIVS